MGRKQQAESQTQGWDHSCPSGQQDSGSQGSPAPVRPTDFHHCAHQKEMGGKGLDSPFRRRSPDRHMSTLMVPFFPGLQALPGQCTIGHKVPFYWPVVELEMQLLD